MKKNQLALISIIKSFIQNHNLIKPGDRILLGVSGGPDSIALAYILRELGGEFGYKINVGHINHQLRQGSDADQRFVQSLCHHFGWSCNVIKLAKVNKSKIGSLEEYAREKRLQALIRIAKKQKATCIALAHHRDDQAETVLMRILRGTGLRGLQAMKPKRKIDGITFIRPFLKTPRADIDRFLRQNKIAFRCDPTNHQKKFLRNRIRLELMPILARYNPNIREVLANLAENTLTDYEYIRYEGIKQFRKLRDPNGDPQSVRLKLADLRQLPQSLRRFVILCSIETVQGSTRRITSTHLQRVDHLIDHPISNCVIHLPRSIRVVEKNAYLWIRSKSQKNRKT